MKICISTANTLYYPQGGHLWVFINWALGFRAIGCEVLWLDVYRPHQTVEENQRSLAILKQRLQPFDLDNCILLAPEDGGPERQQLDALPVAALQGSDLLFNLRYNVPHTLMQHFRTSVLLDIDPGMTQQTLGSNGYNCPPHDLYYTIGEGVVSGATQANDVGVEWQYLPPAVFLDAWNAEPPPADAPFTTVSHWESDDWQVDPDGSVYQNHKKAAFEPFFDLPRHVNRPLELSLHLPGDLTEAPNLRAHGWVVREAHDAAGSPDDFRRYVHRSAGEFSCAKPWYVRRKTGWISDRTPCYLAAGRPAILEDTGPCPPLEGVDAGLLRFTTIEQAADRLRRVNEDYATHARAARALAEEHFDARKLARRVLERAF